MRLLIVALLLVPIAARAETKLAGNVLVWADAKWFVDANDKAPSIQLAKTRALHHVVPAKLVAISNDFVEVELQKASDCAWVNAVTSELANVRLFVKRTDLAPVLAKPFRATYRGGSRIELQPGVPVMAADKHSRISIGGDEVIVEIPQASLGLSYAAPKLKPLPNTQRAKLSVDAEVDATLGNHAMRVEHHTALAVTPQGKTTVFPLFAPCIAARVVVPKEAVLENAIGFGAKSAGGVAGRPIQERWYIAKGTALLGPSGRTVAKAAVEIDVPKPDPTATQVCHASDIGLARVVERAPAIEPTTSGRTLTLCVPIAQIKHVNPMPPRP